jgi:hypothetical protein
MWWWDVEFVEIIGVLEPMRDVTARVGPAHAPLTTWTSLRGPGRPPCASARQLLSVPTVGALNTDIANLRRAGLANLTGVPGISILVGLYPTGWPIGVQLLAPWNHEARLLAAVPTRKISSVSAVDPRLEQLKDELRSLRGGPEPL